MLSGGNLPHRPVEPPANFDQCIRGRRLASQQGANSMLTARVTFGLGGLMLVNLLLVSLQLLFGVDTMPI
jgi:hypothetical protein